MALYVGDNKQRKVILDGVVYCLRVIPEAFNVYGTKLLSSDNYTLRDANGLYLTTKESE